MKLKTLTMASLLEFQGHKQDALEMYKDILRNDTKNKEALSAIRRLSGIHKKYKGVNTLMKDKFVKMQSDEEFLEFERWLIRVWN
jgi:hypothetical protein